MDKRLEGKIAIVSGAGQRPGDTIGNGRAMAVLFARAGAKIMLVDYRLEAAGETKTIIDQEGGTCFAFAADVTKSENCKRMAEACVETYGRVDILVNNVGMGGGSDYSPVQLLEEEWDRIYNTNIKSAFLTCKHVLPVMEKQESGAILNISSVAAIAGTNMVAYKSSKAAVNALTHSIAIKYAKKGIRVNCIMPGLMNTPMAIEGISGRGRVAKQDLIDQRNDRVPLKGGMGSGWDTAYAALFLCSDEAKFVTGVIMAVDGGQSIKTG
ncbi:MAG: SDR family oxidoreductase [Deltaproteobacteria bacterium]|nr:SDR family oxidoreductase [Deltaproteobacteria bacterium]